MSREMKYTRLAAAVLAGAVGVVMVPLGAVPAAAAAINDPPVAPHSIIVFPVRDFVSAAGYATGDRPTVQIVRGGAVVGTATNVVPQDDPATPGFDGFVEVNHPGGACWEGVTPDIRPGDVARILTAPGIGDQTSTANVTVTQPATKVNASTVVMKGTAIAAGGGQIPASQLEARVVAGRQSFVINGKRTIRAAAGGGDGTLAYDGPGLTSWTATFTGLGQVSTVDGTSDADRAVANESRALWLGTDPATTAEATIFEFGQFAGPGAPCTAPLANGPSAPDMTAATDTGSSSTDNLTANRSPVFTGATALTTSTGVNLYVDGALRGTATVGAGGTYSVAPDLPLASGAHSVTASEFATGVPETMSTGTLRVTVDIAGPTARPGTPAAGTTAVSQTSNVTATFSENVTGVSSATFTLKNAAGAAVASAVSYNATTRVATLNPGVTLAADTRYTATVSAGIKDTAGNPLTASSWSFTTGPRPTVGTKSPAPGAVGVSRVANVTAALSEKVTGVTSGTFALRNAATGSVISAVVSYNATTRVATLNPGLTLTARTKYTAGLSGGIKDAAGNSLLWTSWSFTTGP
ncbi:Ig-like domain-containing protein [Micrococcaceae bacterium Sec5.7]